MTHSESDTRSKLIDPSIKDSGWLESKDPLDGLQQSINYAQRLKIDFVYATNGHKIYEHSLLEGKGSFIENYPTLDELFERKYSNQTLKVKDVSTYPFHIEGLKASILNQAFREKV